MSGILIRIPYAIPGKDHTENVSVHGHTGIGKRTFLQLCPKRMQKIYGRMGELFQSTKEKTGTFLKINSMTNYSILIKTEKTWKIFMKNIFQDSGSGNLRATGMITDILSCAIRYMVPFEAIEDLEKQR